MPAVIGDRITCARCTDSHIRIVCRVQVHLAVVFGCSQGALKSVWANLVENIRVAYIFSIVYVCQWILQELWLSRSRDRSSVDVDGISAAQSLQIASIGKRVWQDSHD